MATKDWTKATNTELAAKLDDWIHPECHEAARRLRVGISQEPNYGLNFTLGKVIDIIFKNGHSKDGVRELEKARWFLEREIAHRKERK